MTYLTPPKGWFTFGTHLDDKFPLDFSEEKDEDGHPHWERPARAAVPGEVRFPGKPLRTGSVEFGCLTQTMTDGSLDRVYVGETEGAARREVGYWQARGMPAVLVTRTIPAWEDV